MWFLLATIVGHTAYRMYYPPETYSGLDYIFKVDWLSFLIGLCYLVSILSLFK
jgi:hypothetical protein